MPCLDSWMYSETFFKKQRGVVLPSSLNLYAVDDVLKAVL